MTKHGDGFRLPAFFDSHLHFLGIGYVSSVIELKNATSIAEVISCLRLDMGKNIIVGRGWNQNQFLEKRMITKHDLDPVFPDCPVVLYRTCGHVAVANSKMLSGLHLDANTEVDSGGTFDFETGIFTENALGLLKKAMAVPTDHQIKDYFIKANGLLLAKGITTVLSDDFMTLPVPYEAMIRMINELYEANLLQVRIIEQVHLPAIELFRDFIAKGYANRDFGKWKLGPLKLLADGSLGGRTAFLHEPYSDDLNQVGVQTFSDFELKEFFDLANLNQMDCHIHAIGDRAITQVLTVMEQSLIDTNRKNHRHAIIHAQLANRLHIKKMKQLNISAIVQPIFLESDIAMVDSRIGKRKEESYLFHMMKTEGLHVGFSTDSPVEDFNPFYNLYASMSRQSFKDHALGAFLPQEAFSLKAAWECYHDDNRYLIYEENQTPNDFIVVDRNIEECSLMELRDTVVLETKVAGNVVYRK